MRIRLGHIAIRQPTVTAAPGLNVIREKLVQLLGDVPRIELFARQSSHGFDVWGNQCIAPAVELLPGCAVPVVKTEAA